MELLPAFWIRVLQASLTRWMWVWVNSGSWWWTGRPAVLQFIGSQRVGHDWATELNWADLHFALSSANYQAISDQLTEALERILQWLTGWWCCLPGAVTDTLTILPGSTIVANLSRFSKPACWGQLTQTHTTALASPALFTCFANHGAGISKMCLLVFFPTVLPRK